MKKFILLSSLILCIFASTVISVSAEQKIATIDIQKIVENSVQVQTLNKEQAEKIQELEKWVESVKKDIEKQPTQEAKEKAFNKHRTAYFNKKDEIIKEGQTKMQAYMNSISDAIQKQAKEKGYNMVILKSAVVYGGEDITEDVEKIVNSKVQPKVQNNTKKIKTQNNKK